jgi:hypothetical protein
MATVAAPKVRKLVVVAQDPGVLAADGTIVTGELTVPYEELDPGPVGHRVHVVDYDATHKALLAPAMVGDGARPDDRAILADPAFHAQNVYAIVMATLLRFEAALGRRVEWAFPAHQIKVVPHAFEIANAFYSRRDEAILFGYFRRAGTPIFTCLSHDIVAHETTHALVDGLRSGFMRPSSADQAGFHEGFADLVALLSVLAMKETVVALLDLAGRRQRGLIERAAVDLDALRDGLLFGLAEQMDPGLSAARINALRRSVLLDPEKGILKRIEYDEPHRRGEVLVAAMMRAFLEIWQRRFAPLGGEGAPLDLDRVSEEGAAVAQQLLTAVIRALDYTPPIHLTFGEFLSAVLTADAEVRADDSRYALRATLRTWFANFGIEPAGTGPDGMWPRADVELRREGVRFGSLRTDPTEMFRLLWANRGRLGLRSPAYTTVRSVRPCLRVGPEDGLPVQETVAECVQYLKVTADELSRYGLTKPPGMAEDTEILLEGGSTLVLDEYGTLKFRVHNPVPDASDEQAVARTQVWLDYMWRHGYLDEASFASRLAEIHRLRVAEASPTDFMQGW